jgi:hypothetical protein
MRSMCDDWSAYITPVMLLVEVDGFLGRRIPIEDDEYERLHTLRDVVRVVARALASAPDHEELALNAVLAAASAKAPHHSGEWNLDVPLPDALWPDRFVQKEGK